MPRSGTECPACPHPLGTHDTIARRYCAASAASHATDRGCVCGTVQDHVKAPEPKRTYR
ncbi:RGCVC family protein [Amycolatopsis sp. NPDC051758]|uniref:RGCVC family protein n=1 Tax=Amycolatopsis sp. NPDC051758 TaxID=3363935 RepID=UPI0037AA593A